MGKATSDGLIKHYLPHLFFLQYQLDLYALALPLIPTTTPLDKDASG